MSQATALLLTLAIEVPLVLGLAAALGWARGERFPLALAALGGTLVTHPVVWWGSEALAGAGWSYEGRLALLEAFAVLVEAAGYALAAGLGWRRGVVASLLANAASFGTGLLIWALGGA